MLDKLLFSIKDSDMSLCGHRHLIETFNTDIFTDDYILEKYDNQIIDRKTFYKYFLNSAEKGICTYSVRILYKRDIILNNNLLFNSNLTYGEDLLFVLQYVNFIDNIRLIKDKCYVYRLNNNSVTQNNIKNYIENKIYIENWLRDNLLKYDYFIEIYHWFRTISYISTSRYFKDENTLYKLKKENNYMESLKYTFKYNFKNLSRTNKVITFLLRFNLEKIYIFIRKRKEKIND